MSSNFDPGLMTRWWWIRHAPVTVNKGTAYGQTDHPCDTSTESHFKGWAELLPKDAVWVPRCTAGHPDLLGGWNRVPPTPHRKRNVMPSQVVTVASKVGLHARPAALLIKAAKEAAVPVTVGRPGEAGVNAASMLSVLALGAKHGEAVEITVAEGPDSDRILATLVDIVATNHDE